ncbi:MAG: RluA family pseudouridine synthase [Lachnospiraceae bacterium]|nr:RluA family pseudouridine synthase [Lachnospiraceae bacterium]
MLRVLTYIARPSDAIQKRAVRDVIRDDFGLVHHDVSRAKYETSNGITVNGRPVRVNYLLKPGDILKVRLADRLSERIVPSQGPLEIVFEDEDLIILNKPAGIVVHPSHGHFSDSLANYLCWYYKMNNDPHEIRTIGRLDKDTSGLIAFGKSRSAVAHLVEQAEKGRRRKVYYALAEGFFEEQKGRIAAPIKREFEGEMKRIACEGGDEALTEYEVVRQYPDYALLKIQIRTGRTHQIRVHMNYIGHPLLGDSLYGSGPVDCLERAALHAGFMQFYQPFNGNSIRIGVKMPADMQHFLTESLLDTEPYTW